MKNILIVGVGGQGTLLASRVLGHLALSQGLDVKISEVHGMAQRGGSVVTHVRMGEKIYSPLVEPGEADIIIAFEQLEALRYCHYLKKGGLLVAGKQQISPMPVITGAVPYPQETQALLKDVNVQWVEALSLALDCGSVKSVNMVLLGAASAASDFSQEAWLQAIAHVVPPKTVAVNQKAFLCGRAIATASQK